MEFIRPVFEKKIILSGVYKITFDDHWFYIGSSVNLKSRAAGWNGRFNSPRLLKNKNIKYIFPTITKAVFEIIEVCENDLELLRAKETQYIGLHWNNPLLLNICPDGATNAGLRASHIIPEIIKPARLKGPISLPKKVAVFNSHGHLIKVCDSFTKCSKEFRIKHEDIHKILSGKRGQPARVDLKLVNDDGSFSDPPKFIPAKGGNINGRNIAQYDKQGNFIKDHSSIVAAAVHLNGNKSGVSILRKLLAGQKWYKSYKGFIFKYT